MEVITVPSPPARPRPDKGFTLLEVLISMMVITVALTGLLALFGTSIITVTHAQEELTAKQKAREALESIYTARNTRQITFDMVDNLSQGGIFLDGPQPLRRAGPDGLVGTADDGALEVLEFPGPDGALGTADDETIPLDHFQREVVISAAESAGGLSDLKQIMIRIRYKMPGRMERNYEVHSFISKYR